MISLSVVIITMVIVLGALWMIIKFNKGESLDRKYRSDSKKFQSNQHVRKQHRHQHQRQQQKPKPSTPGPVV